MLSQSEIEHYRSETPGTADVLHFNNAGASMCAQPVVDTVIGHVKREAAIGGYEAAAEAQPRLAQTYDSIAGLIDASPGEIAFMDSATRAWNTILYSLALKTGDKILTLSSEFGSNVVSLAQVARRTGATIEVVPSDVDGSVDPDEFAKRLTDQVKLVAISHIPMHRGIANPVADVGKLLANHHAFYLVDACQSVGQMPVSVHDLHCDALTATGRKWLRAPRGTGFLYVKESWIPKIEPLTVDLASADLVHPDRLLGNTDLEIRSDAKRFETWERSIALVLGLGTAVDYAQSVGLDRIHETVLRLAKALRQGLETCSDLRVADGNETVCGIVTVVPKNRSASAMKQALSSQGINTSVAYTYDSPLDLPARGLEEVLRVSPHYYNTLDEVSRFVEAIRALAA